MFGGGGRLGGGRVDAGRVDGGGGGVADIGPDIGPDSKKATAWSGLLLLR